MKKFLSFALAAMLAVVFSAFTTTETGKIDGLWYEDPNAPGVFHEYTGSIESCLPSGTTECSLPVEQEGGTVCPIFFDNMGINRVKYQAR